MNILITGGGGFIGSHIAKHYHKSARVRVLDNFRTGKRENLDGLDIDLHDGSITDRDVVRMAMKGVNLVFHMAAMVSVPESVQNPMECAKTNVIGLLNVLEEAHAANVRKVCFSSSAAVYGNNPVVPKREGMLPEPRSPYAITKLDGEYYCGLYSDAAKLEAVSLRFFNVFGPGQNPEGAYAAAVPIFFRQALNGEPITVFGDGGQTRDFIYVEDIVGALSFLADSPGIRGVFNAGYGEQVTILELAKRIITLTNSKSEIRFAPERLGDVRHSRADISRLREAGFHPKGSLDLGLKRMLASFRDLSS